VLPALTVLAALVIAAGAIVLAKVRSTRRGAPDDDRRGRPPQRD
jgi:hypothetical protein